eukprot:m.28419 g.28419  ORF g.28419 m.28419 type:complete len:166 (+) comp9468_c0_seq1:120-617(+)
MSSPLEVSSKKKPKLMRQVVKNVNKPRDPRFDERAGTLNQAHVNSMYSFLDEQRRDEIQKLKKKLKKTKGKERKEEVQRALQSLREKARARKQKTEQQKMKSQRNKTARKSKNSSFHLKSSDSKKLELLYKFQQLKKEGKLGKALKNRRKRNIEKDKKKLSATHN